MKIIYIANIRIPTEKAHGYQIMKTCESLAAGGAKVELVVPTRQNPTFASTDPFIHYQIKPIFGLQKIKTLDPRFFLWLPAGSYLFVQAALFRLGLKRFLSDQSRAEVVFYTRDEYLLPYLQKFTASIIWEAHNLPRSRKYYLKFWQRCRRIITITNGLKKELVALGIPSAKVQVAPDGVDLSKFDQVNIGPEEARKKLDLPVSKKIVLYVGHLYKWKGAEALAEAAKKLKDDCLVVFVGGVQGDLEKFKEKYGQNNNIFILGQKPHEIIPLYLRAADILVLPNSAKSDVSKYYTSPMKMFEYMAAQKPIVASDLPSLREVLNENNCVFCQPDSPDDLATKIKLTLRDNDLIDKISKQSYRDVKKYQWQQRAISILNFIK